MSKTIDLFKVMVADKGGLNLTNAVHGFVTDFVPTPAQLAVLKEKFRPLPVVTMFSVEERKNASLEYLISKQILHYIETYGLETPGLFNLEVTNGKIATIAYIKAVTVEELQEKVHELIYANRPIADVAPVVEVMREYGIHYEINQVKNNELRVALFEPTRDTFKDGDDAVRWICYNATASALLIKDKKTIDLVRPKAPADWFFSRHTTVLAKVFNRHKRIIMACKNPATASTINKISKLSKTTHVPIKEPISKRFISEALSGLAPTSLLDKISLRDKFKYLNLIEYKLLGLSYDSFNIRNGKVWFELNRAIERQPDLKALRSEVLISIGNQLVGLRGQSVLVDPNVDYGLPISRKQAMGNLPFGTRVTGIKGRELSAGVYWHNDWSDKSRVDLDLSAIDDKGSRTGWGQYSGYDKKNPITYSGDVTDARNGATEFMVVRPDAANRYGLMVNIFTGQPKCDTEIVVGHPDKNVWQEHTFIRERITLQTQQSLVGFLKDDAFVVYTGRLSNTRVSRGKHPVIDKGLGTLWTVRNLLDALGVRYDTTPKADTTYAHDLRYVGFTQDKLERLFNI